MGDCNLDLCLFSAGTKSDPPSRPRSCDSWSEDPAERSQKLTICYDGRVTVCEVTELQARAILDLAKREADEQRRRGSSGVDHQSPKSQCQPHELQAISMKRSLQRFLQKRKNRSQSVPYTRWPDGHDDFRTAYQ